MLINNYRFSKRKILEQTCGSPLIMESVIVIQCNVFLLLLKFYLLSNPEISDVYEIYRKCLTSVTVEKKYATLTNIV